MYFQATSCLATNIQVQLRKKNYCIFPNICHGLSSVLLSPVLWPHSLFLCSTSMQWSVLGILFVALREDFKPHHCDTYQYLLLLPPQLLLCWSAFTHFFFSFFSAGISNFQPFHWHLLLSASNSTDFQGYPEQFHLIYILWKVSLTDSSLSSDLPFQSLKHKLLCYLAILFPARILPEDKLLDSS